MSKAIAKLYLKIFRWEYNDFPDVKKAVVTMAPHTSWRDFILGKVYFASQGLVANAMIKKEAFIWPFGYFLKKMGAIPVDRGKKSGLTQQSIDFFKEDRERFYLIITPEGTRRKTKNWKKGCVRIAKAAEVPIALGFIDCENRKMGNLGLLDMDGDDKEIMERLKRKYKGLQGLHKGKFTTGYE